LAQINFSKLDPGAVKAFHIHKEQIDVWFVFDKALVSFADFRQDSKTRDNVIRTTMENQFVIIPAGVAHGIANPYKTPVHMAYFVNKVFNPDDELRLPWHIFGLDHWDIKKG
jgi:dTDP-4-dehydrorhamnose 3,5-epimerase